MTEINAVQDYGFGFVVADRFGRLDMGRFVTDEHGTRAELSESARRLPWREQTVELAGELGSIVVHRLQLEPVDGKDAAENAACARGIAATASKLGLASCEGLEVYVYPDRRSKQQLCGSGGDGNANVSSSTLHLLPFDASPGGAMQLLVQHESCHILASRAFGTPGSGLCGEGLAVWAAGGYGGRPLRDYADAEPPRAKSLEELFGVAFFRIPEGQSYPLAGRLVGEVIADHGLEAFLAKLYPAPAAEVERACERLGVSFAQLEKKYTPGGSGS